MQVFDRRDTIENRKFWQRAWPVLLWFAIAFPIPAFSAPPLETEADADINSRDQRIPFILNVQGLDPTGLKQRFLELSLLNAGLKGNSKNHIDSRGSLSRRLSQDIQTLTKLLRAAGFYDATIDPEVAPAPGLPNAVVVQIIVDPGAQYRFGMIDIGGDPSPSLRLSLAKAGLRADAPARAAAVLDSLELLKTRLPQLGNPFFTLGEPDVVVDHATTLVDVTVPLAPGPTVNFGTLNFTGTVVAKPSHLVRLARFKPGQRYDQRQADDLREALLATGLYSSLSITPVKRTLPDGSTVADIVVEGQPTRNRTLAFSAGYDTTSGPRTEVDWQHRNLFGGEERLIVTGILGTAQQSLSANLRKANFHMRDQNLLGNIGVSRESTDAYRSLNGTISAGIERQTERLWQKKWTYSVQTQFQVDRVQTLMRNAQNINAVVKSESFKLISLPSVVRYDNTASLFDPLGGFRASLSLTPELSVRGGAHGYVVTEVQASYYHSLGVRLPLTLASHARVGSILGAHISDIPINRLFYSGGGGSVRGYGYQRLAADSSGAPLGGKSIAEASFEARVKITPTLGVVPFIDGGTVYNGNGLQFGNVRWGAGLGLRYYTSFAPVRVDLATPLGRRRFVSAAGVSSREAPVQIYVSVGQSF